MKLLRSALFAAVVVSSASVCLAMETPFAGTWKLNPVKSWRAGPHGLAGAWDDGGFEGNNASLLVISDRPNGLAFDEPGFRLKASAYFNGQPSSLNGPNIPVGAALLLTRISNRSFRLTRTENGKPLDTSTWTVSADGKTLKSIDRLAGSHRPPTTEVFDKQ